MDENWNPERIKQLLNRSLGQIAPSTIARLNSARIHALNRYETGSVTLPLFTWIGEHIIQPAQAPKGYYWIGAILLAASLYSGFTYWQQSAENDTSDEDIAILTDDLTCAVLLGINIKHIIYGHWPSRLPAYRESCRGL